MRDPQPPSDPAPDVMRLMPARAENARALYVINLSSSHTPMPLEMPDVRGFFGLAVFRSRRVEDGHDRYRLHLGYFESRADAERALPAVQRRYPTAWIAAAPRSGLGSLDDTNVSEFRLIHTPVSAAQPALAASPEPAAAEIPVAAPQRYVVQLVWSDQRVDPNQIPQLAIYDAYTMYTVTVMRGGTRYYGIRLGFFTSVISARQIALYVRPDFAGVAVVPVSSREYDVARTIAWHRDARTAVGAEAKPAPAATWKSATAIAEPPPTTVASAAAAADSQPAPRTPPDVSTPPPAEAAASAEPEKPPSILEPLRVVSARLVESTAADSLADAKATSRPEPIVLPERPAQAVSPAPQSATMKMREEARRRGPAFSNEELLAALRATERSSDVKHRDPEAPPSYAGTPAHKRESAIRRFWHRLLG
jgi:hypothetical protein